MCVCVYAKMFTYIYMFIRIYYILYLICITRYMFYNTFLISCIYMYTSYFISQIFYIQNIICIFTYIYMNIICIHIFVLFIKGSLVANF